MKACSVEGLEQPADGLDDVSWQLGWKVGAIGCACLGLDGVGRWFGWMVVWTRLGETIGWAGTVRVGGSVGWSS